MADPMMNDDVASTVRDFFSTVGQAGLVLPNGWFGRPHDNLLLLTRSEASNGSVLLEFDAKDVLQLFGRLSVARTDRGLSLSGFDRLAWTWADAGSAEVHREEFVHGEVEFVASD